MPIELISEDALPKRSRESKIDRTPEWRELSEQLNTGIPTGRAIRITFGPETIKVFGNDAKKAAFAFVLRLRADYRDRYKIKAAGPEVHIMNKEEKS